MGKITSFTILSIGVVLLKNPRCNVNNGDRFRGHYRAGGIAAWITNNPETEVKI